MPLPSMLNLFRPSHRARQGDPESNSTGHSTAAARRAGGPGAPAQTRPPVVHTEYDPAQVPAKPDPPEQWTRFVCISDTHSHTFPVPDGDVLLHAGDLTHSGRRAHFEATMAWLVRLPHAVKIVIAGNHDLPLHQGWYDTEFHRWHPKKEELDPIVDMLKGKRAKQGHIVYLQDECYSFRVKRPDGSEGREWTVYGSPWSPEFYNWAFNYARGDDAEKRVKKIPQTDILLTHGPPHGILDETLMRDHVGCEALAARLERGALRPRLHVFGHIHESHGAETRVWKTGGRVEQEEDKEEGEGEGEGEEEEEDGEEKSEDGDKDKDKESVDDYDAEKIQHDEAPASAPAPGGAEGADEAGAAVPAAADEEAGSGNAGASATATSTATATATTSPSSASSEATAPVAPTTSHGPALPAPAAPAAPTPPTEASTTVFVNAASWPMGVRARAKGGPKAEFGRGAFCPVIVDLFDG